MFPNLSQFARLPRRLRQIHEILRFGLALAGLGGAVREQTHDSSCSAVALAVIIGKGKMARLHVATFNDKITASSQS